MTLNRSWTAAEQVSRAVGTHARVVEATEAGTPGSFAGSPSSGGAGVGGAGRARARAPGGRRARAARLTRITIAPR